MTDNQPPTPYANESEADFVARYAKFLQAENAALPKDKQLSKEQIEARALSAWRSRKNAVPKMSRKERLDGIVKRIEELKDVLIEKFGSKGRTFYEFTLLRLGAFDAATKSYNENALLECPNLPYFVKHEDGSVEIGNVILAEAEFAKVDADSGIVEGYANTIVADMVDDVIFPEAYADSAAKMTTTYFMHHTDMPDGVILEQKIDKVGWWVKSQVAPEYRGLLKNGTLKAYSIGGRFVLPPDWVGYANVYDKKASVVITDLSHVTSPCNRLAFFQNTVQKSDDAGSVSKSLFLTAATSEKGSGCATIKGTVPADCTGGNKPIGSKILTNDKTQTVDIPELRPLTNEELVKMTPAEIQAHMAKQAEAKVKLELMKQVRVNDEQLKELNNEDRLKDINEAIGKLVAKVDGFVAKIAEIETGIADLRKELGTVNGKVQKMEDAPEYKKLDVTPVKTTRKPLTTLNAIEGF
jgi:hypothetical protein